MSSSERSLRQPGTRMLLIVAGVLALLRIGTAYLAVPAGLATFLSVLATLIFVAWPILAIFRAAGDRWDAKTGFILLGIGVALHLGGVLVARFGLHDQGPGAVFLIALAQSGLLLWCVALGALLSMLIRDKNLLLPVAIFLAGLDMFLVFAPVGIARQIVEKNPELFKSVAYTVPKVATGEPTGMIVPMAFVGPADFFFLAMFFVAICRFNMRVHETLKWIVPVLLGYLAIVMLAGGVRIGPISLGMLPALLPIGLTVLLVNRKEFKLAKDEKAATVVVGLIAVALAGLAIWMSLKASKPGPQVVPSTTGDAPGASAPSDSREPLSEGPPK